MKNVALAAVLLLVLTGYAEAAPRAFVDAVIHVESRGNARAVGRHGELGLGQLKLQTARGMGYRGNRAGLFDPKVNRHYTERYLDMALKRAGGRLCHAASLYNMGLGARPRCTAYGKRVVSVMGRRK
jgi:soluble lytic murein transglycosylase-like protein